MAVSVIVPFAGELAEAQTAIAALELLELGDEDEIVLVDNTPGAIVPDPGGRIVLVRAAEQRSAYYARNAGVERAGGDWLLFLDADCVAPPSLLADYFGSPPGERVGVLAGELEGDPAQGALTARWSRSRRGMRSAQERVRGPASAGVTGNMAVRRAAWEEVGGFPEGVRSDADVELCWRIQAAGWALEYRPEALVVHRDPERVRAVWSQAVLYGAGRRWTHGLHPDTVPRPPLAAPLMRALGGAVVWAVTLRGERAAFKLLDGVAALGLWWGYVAASNKAR
jgi:glycosyltransferase involved in cell wall biosynthesis